MSRLEQIEEQISSLTTEEFIALREWFINRDAEQWDKQIEADSLGGKLDPLAEQALLDHKAAHLLS